MTRKKARQPLEEHAETPTTQRCALCGREVERVSQHHIIPKSRGGTETVPLCSPCHSTLHHFFRNRTLAREKNSLDALLSDPDIQRYLVWVRKQPDRRIQVRARKDRR